MSMVYGSQELSRWVPSDLLKLWLLYGQQIYPKTILLLKALQSTQGKHIVRKSTHSRETRRRLWANSPYSKDRSSATHVAQTDLPHFWNLAWRITLPPKPKGPLYQISLTLTGILIPIWRREDICCINMLPSKLEKVQSISQLARKAA